MSAEISGSPHATGKVLRALDFDGFSVEEVMMPADLSVAPHEHSGAQIYFVLEGEYMESAQGRQLVLSPGAALFRPARALHSNRVVGEEPALTLIATFESARLAPLERLAGNVRELQSLAIDEIRMELVRELERDDSATRLAVEGWALLLLSRTERVVCAGDPHPPAWLAEAVRLIGRSFLEPLSLSQLAKQISVHPATLAAGFRHHFASSVGEYIRKLRLSYAREELLRSDLPLKELALRAGFYDQAHFGRHFKRLYGVSPAAFRADLRR